MKKIFYLCFLLFTLMINSQTKYPKNYTVLKETYDAKNDIKQTKIKYFNPLVGRYVTLNIISKPKAEALNQQEYEKSKSHSIFNQEENSTNEKLKDWVFPSENNFIKFKTKSFVDGKIELSSLIVSYYKISDKQMGSSLEIDKMNEDPSCKLFEINDNEIRLIKEKDAVFGNMGGEEITFTENNIYLKLPSQNETIKWNYSEIGGVFYDCKSYWKIGADNERLLVVEKEMFENKNVKFSREISIEYFKKGKGLVKSELKASKTNKLLESEIAIESGFDPEIKSENFPLLPIEKSNETVQNSTDKKVVVEDSIKAKIVYPDGTIPKEYKMQVLLDKGLPYFVKDTITIKNTRGISGITPPKFIKSEHTIYFEEKEVFTNGDGELQDAKIVDIKYFKSPFSFKQELFYSDGEGNIKRVENKKIFVDINYRMNNKSSSDDFIMKEQVNKQSDLYRELNEIMKKQGIYLIINETNEENVKSKKAVYINFQQE